MIYFSKFAVVFLIYLSTPLLFAVWGLQRGKNGKKEFCEVLFCMIAMPLVLGFFGNTELSDFLKQEDWTKEDPHAALKMWAYSVVFGLGGMRMIKKVYEGVTGDKLDPLEIEEATNSNAEKLEKTLPFKEIKQTDAAGLLQMFNVGNSTIPVANFPGNEEIKNLLEKFIAIGGIRKKDDAYHLTPVGRRMLESKVARENV